MDYHVLELVTWLHRLISLVRYNGPKAFPGRSPTRKGLNLQTELMMNTNSKTPKIQISLEDRTLLEKVMKQKCLVPGRSKSQEFLLPKNRQKVWALSRSMGNSPRTDFQHPKATVLDILDGLHQHFELLKRDLKQKKGSFFCFLDSQLPPPMELKPLCIQSLHHMVIGKNVILQYIIIAKIHLDSSELNVHG